MNDPVGDKLRALRDFINQERVQTSLMVDQQKWNMTCSSLDSIGDAEAALDAFPAAVADAGTDIILLAIFGMLQALYVQQDATTCLYKSLGMEWAMPPAVSSIRNVRNCVLHPNEQGPRKGPFSYHFVPRAKISADGFDLQSYDHENRQTLKSFKCRELVGTQRELILAAIDAVLCELQRRDEEHRKKHASVLMTKLFVGYVSELEQLHRRLKDASDPRWQFGISRLRLMLDAFEQELKKRGYSLSTYHLADSMNEALFAIDAFEAFATGDKPIDTRSAKFHVEAISRRIDQFREVAGEIDKDFGAN